MRTDFEYNKWYSIKDALPEDFFDDEEIRCVVWIDKTKKKPGRWDYDYRKAKEWRYEWFWNTVSAWMIPKIC